MELGASLARMNGWCVVINVDTHIHIHRRSQQNPSFELPLHAN